MLFLVAGSGRKKSGKHRLSWRLLCPPLRQLCGLTASYTKATIGQALAQSCHTLPYGAHV